MPWLPLQPRAILPTELPTEEPLLEKGQLLEKGPGPAPRSETPAANGASRKEEQPAEERTEREPSVRKVSAQVETQSSEPRVTAPISSDSSEGATPAVAPEQVVPKMAEKTPADPAPVPQPVAPVVPTAAVESVQEEAPERAEPVAPVPAAKPAETEAPVAPAAKAPESTSPAKASPAKAEAKPEVPSETAAKTTGFSDLGLHPMLVEGLTEGGYTAPTPIQEQAIPPLLQGRDVVGQAQTGTGKTAAFSLPLIQGLDIGRRDVQALVLCPTRELALQVTEAIRTYGESRRVRVLTVYGGAPITKQLSKLRAGVHVVVGTPGRVKDVISRRALNLKTVRKVVLDEADEMLRMGFIDDVKEILSQVPEERQTALFSATMPQVIRNVAESYLRDPVQVKLTPRKRTVERIEQRVMITHASDKPDILARIIEAEPTDAVLVFARTRVSCAELVDKLRARGVAGAALHGDLSQDQREEIVMRLRSRKIQLVVATDVAARGLDVEGITHVINYDPPIEPEVYVHRIGRTGRAGRDGVSILLLTPREQRMQKRIEFYTGQRMSPMNIPTNEEILAGRTARFATQIVETVQKGGLEPYLRFVDELLDEHCLDPQPGADLRQFAAALARLASRERPLIIRGPEPTKASLGRGAVARSGPPRGGHGRGGHDRRGGGNWTKLFVSLGHQAGLQPGDLVGAIANEAGVPGRAIGAIDIRETVSFVEVAAEHAEAVLERMSRVILRGRPAAFVMARPDKYDRSGGGGGHHGGGGYRGGQRPGGHRSDGHRPGGHRPGGHRSDSPRSDAPRSSGSRPSSHRPGGYGPSRDARDNGDSGSNGSAGHRGKPSFNRSRPSFGRGPAPKKPHRGKSND